MSDLSLALFSKDARLSFDGKAQASARLLTDFCESTSGGHGPYEEAGIDIAKCLFAFFACERAMNMAKTYTIKDVSAKTGLAPKRVRALHRAFVRKSGGTIGQDTPGKGKTYSLSQSEFTAFCNHVMKGHKAEQVQKAKAAAATRKASTPAPIAPSAPQGEQEGESE